MHQIPNIDGSGKPMPICNCCGCSCLSICSEMYKNVDMIRSNYVSRIDKDKCEFVVFVLRMSNECPKARSETLL